MAWVTKDSVEQYDHTPEPPKEYTKKEKAQNWWHYHKFIVLGVVVAILVALLLHGIEKAQNRQTEDYLLIELPEYKMPDLHTVAIYMWEKVKSYLEKAGTTIFVATILIWFLLNFGPSGYTSDAGESFGAILGHVLVPVFRPIGLGFWQICLALLAGISAKEVVVSSCCALWHHQRQFRGRHGGICRGPGSHRLHQPQCPVPDGVLSAVCALCRGPGYHPQGKRQLEMDLL